GSIVSILVLLPLLHPASLPKQTLSMLLAAPAPPTEPPPPMPHAVNATHAAVPVNPFSPPLIVPNSISSTDQEPPPAVGTGINPLARDSEGLFNALPDSIG